MKRLNEDGTLSIHLYDIANINRFGLVFPASILDKTRKSIITDKEGEYSVLAFTSPEEIDFFMSLDFIPNTAEYEKKTAENISEEARRLTRECGDVVNSLGSLDNYVKSGKLNDEFMKKIQQVYKIKALWWIYYSLISKREVFAPDSNNSPLKETEAGKILYITLF